MAENRKKSSAILNGQKDEKGRYLPKNTYSQKYTPDKVHKILRKIKKNLDTDPEILNLIDACLSVGLPSTWLFSQRQRFSDDPEVTEMIDYIYDTCENRLWKKTSTNSINQALGLFSLRAYHKRFDTAEQGSQNVGDINIKIELPNKKDNDENDNS